VRADDPAPIPRLPAHHLNQVETMPNRFIFYLSVTMSLACAQASNAAALNVQPANGQGAEQTQTDMSQCQATATQATGYLPSESMSSTPTQPKVGGRLKGAAAGATAGAVVAGAQGRQQYENYDELPDDVKQEYRQNEATDATKAGAVVGGVTQRKDRRQARKADQQQASASEAWEQSYTSCLQQRSYVVTP
jgi:hypothetical protein